MSIEELIIDEQLPDHWRRALKRGEVNQLGDSVALKIVTGELHHCWIVFSYDSHRNLVIKLS